MTPEDEQTITQWADQQKTAPVLIAALAGGPASEQMERFCSRFQALVPGLKIKRDVEDPFSTPAIILGHHRNIAYQTIPSGRELPPFLEMLTTAAGDLPVLDTQTTDQLARLSLPLELKLYISLQCPHCPGVVRQFCALAKSSERIRISVIDAGLFNEKAQSDQIRAVPTLILDDQFRWTGGVKIDEVLNISMQRDPSQLSAASLRQMLEAGEAPQVAQMMTDAGRIFPALCELLVHARWSVRLGAMVTVEYLSDTSPALADQLVDPLWERFAVLPEPVQGDVAHVFGQVGSDAAVERLHAVLAGAFAETVREAAAEALADMKA